MHPTQTRSRTGGLTPLPDRADRFILASVGTSTLRGRNRLLLAVALVAAGVVMTAAPAGAAVIEVTTTADGGAGSLRDAFAQASAAVEPTEIVLEAGATYVLDDCAEGDLDHTGGQPLTITGRGATIEQTCAGERVIETGGDLTAVEVTVTGGSPGPGTLGGGIEADTANVTLVRSRVTGNSAGFGGGVGAIRVTLDASTVDDNDASSTGGGVWADQTAEVTNSTVTGNRAGGGGGGLAVVNTRIALVYATVASNEAGVGANLQMLAGSDELTSFASVVAEPGGGGADCDLDPAVVTSSQGYNVAGDASCGFGAAPGDVDGGFPVELGALADNGGPTPTRLPGGFLVDLVECDEIVVDQRGVTRSQGTACDVGAVELEVEEPPGTTDPRPPSDPGSPSPPAVPVRGAALFTG